LAIGADVDVPLGSWFDGGEGEPLVFLALADFFGLFGEDVDMGVAMAAVASLVSLVADLWEEVVAGSCLYLFLPLVSRVDLLRLGVCASAAAAVVLLVSLALGSFLVAVAEAGGGGVVCPSLGAPEPAGPPPPPPDRVLVMDQ